MAAPRRPSEALAVHTPPERLEKQARRLDEDRRVDVLGCRVELVSEAGMPPEGGMRACVDWSNGRGEGVRRGSSPEGQRIQGAPVIGVTEAAALRGPFHLAAVGQRGTRERIRTEAARLGLADGHDLLAVA